MPATILPFERRDAALPPRQPFERLPARPPAKDSPRASPREIAHRWAMLSHLRRHSVSWRRAEAPAGGKPSDTVG